AIRVPTMGGVSRRVDSDAEDGEAVRRAFANGRRVLPDAAREHEGVHSGQPGARSEERAGEPVAEDVHGETRALVPLPLQLEEVPHVIACATESEETALLVQ